MEPLAFAFDDPPPGDADRRRALLGGKGSSLVALVAAGLPVPPGFTLTTEACRRHLAGGWDPSFDDALRRGIERLEQETGTRLGDPAAPLLLSVRSGAASSMPGMLDTVLDVGMTARVEHALASRTGDADFAADTGRRALVSFAEVVLGVGSELVQALRSAASVAEAERVLTEAGHRVPDDPFEQVRAAVRAVFESWRSPRAQRYREVEGIDHDLGTAATVQVMVFGNLGARSGTGVAFSRDPATGAPGLVGDFLTTAQGEDVVAGTHRTRPLADMRALWPDLHAELARIADRLEHDLDDMVDLEFTVEDGRLWMLQARAAKRSPAATVRCAIDMVEDPTFSLDRAQAVARCRDILGDPAGSASLSDGGAVADDEVTMALVPIASGLAASPGRASGVLCTDPDEAVEREAAGERVVLARRETSPADIHGIAASVALFTLRGGLVSHAAVVARDWGLPAVVGADEATITDEGVVGPGGLAPSGSPVTVDGDRGVLLAGTDHIGTSAAPLPGLDTLRRWADELADP